MPLLPPSTTEDQHRLDREALENLVVDNPDLERLEALLDRFNLFEAIGVVRQELRHSDFLAFLLNPQQPHGLSDLFLKRLLQRTLASNRGASLPISLIDLDVWSLDDTLVLREWNNIDLLLVNDTNRLVVIIENKVDTGEHSGQLVRYRALIRQRYPDHAVLALFLTIEGDLPSDEQYVPVSYRVVVDLVEQLLQTRTSSLGSDLQVLLRHYADLLRTHFVSSSEIDQLCLRIYQKHQRALDLIFERRPDRQYELQQFLERLIAETPGFVLDQSGKTLIRFALEEWDTPALRSGSNWTPSGRLLLFWFVNKPDRLDLRMEIGPGPIPVRQQLLDLALAHPPFKVQTKFLNQKYNRIYKREILKAAKLEEGGLEDLESEIRKAWTAFLASDLPVIRKVIRSGEFGILEATADV